MTDLGEVLPVPEAFQVNEFRWRSESEDPVPATLAPVDDRLTAKAALGRVGRGEHLLYRGDFRNAKQLLGAMGRRLPPPPRVATPLEAFRAERTARHREHQTLGRIVVALDRAYRLELASAPDVAEACRQVWGEADADTTVVSLRTLLGMLGAAEWRRRGLKVPLLEGLLTPHYGVYAPTRSEYVELLTHVRPAPHARVLDVGTGTGVLSFVLLQRGAASATATDLDPRAVECATDNARRLGLAERFRAQQASLFVDGRADWVICNPPWIPETPKTRVDRAVFDEGSAVLCGFLAGLADHLAPGGSGVLLLSNLAVLLGLRGPEWLDEQVTSAGLQVAWSRSTPARHGKARDQTDPLHELRSQELTTLYALVPRGA